MIWTIVRVQDAHETDVENPAPSLVTLRARGVFGVERVEKLLAEHGYQLGPIIGPEVATATDWPLTAVCFESKNKAGTHRTDQVHRWPCRRKP